MTDKNTPPEHDRIADDVNADDVEALTDDYEKDVIQPINVDENKAEEVLYGGEESDFDREYWDNEDEHEYYDQPKKTGYHPDEA